MFTLASPPVVFRYDSTQCRVCPGAVSPRLSGVAVEPVLSSTPVLVNDETAVVAPPADATHIASVPTTTQVANNHHPARGPESSRKRRL
jgi:hypothetical protein